jgi:hypothetical protein
VGSIARLTEVIARGAWGTVEAIVLESNACPALELITNDLMDLREGAKDEEDKTAAARFMVLFQQMANYGAVSPKRFKKEMEGFHAFKHEVKNRQIRFPCFQDGKRWILTHGFFKPGARKKGLGEWPEEQIQRACAHRDEYFRRKLKLGVKKEGSNGKDLR